MTPTKTNPIKFGGKEYDNSKELIADLILLIEQLSPKKKGTVLDSLRTVYKRRKRTEEFTSSVVNSTTHSNTTT